MIANWCVFWSSIVSFLDSLADPLLSFAGGIGLAVPSLASLILPRLGCRTP